MTRPSWFPFLGARGRLLTPAQAPVLFLPLHLRRVRGQVVGEPAVAGPEALEIGGLGLPHGPDRHLGGLGDYPVVAEPMQPSAALEASMRKLRYSILASAQP